MSNPAHKRRHVPSRLLFLFTAARKAPYYFRIYARNFIGYSIGVNYKVTLEQSVKVPTTPISITSAVASANKIDISWALPLDTGVLDTSCALLKYRIECAYGSPDMSCTITCANCGDCSWSQIGACCSQDVPDLNNVATLNSDLTSLPQSETRFYVRVLAINDAGEGAKSAVINE